jgi:hypothetical protein
MNFSYSAHTNTKYGATAAHFCKLCLQKAVPSIDLSASNVKLLLELLHQ